MKNIKLSVKVKKPKLQKIESPKSIIKNDRLNMTNGLSYFVMDINDKEMILMPLYNFRVEGSWMESFLNDVQSLERYDCNKSILH